MTVDHDIQKSRLSVWSFRMLCVKCVPQEASDRWLTLPTPVC